jgi:hypothetical protein
MTNQTVPDLHTPTDPTVGDMTFVALRTRPEVRGLVVGTDGEDRALIAWGEASKLTPQYAAAEAVWENATDLVRWGLREQPAPTGYQVLAADLRRIADRFDLAGHVDMSRHQYVRLNIQPRGANDEQTIERTDALGLVLFGRPGQPEAMGDGSYHYDVEGQFGCVAVHLYSGISTETVRMREAAAQAAADAVELARLRAEVARLEARAAVQAHEDADDPTGLTYSRADDDPQVVRPHSPRMPLHVGVREVDGGELVDATPDDPIFCAHETGGDGIALLRRCVRQIRWDEADARWRHVIGDAEVDHEAVPPGESVRELLAIAPSADGGVAWAMAPAGAVVDPAARAAAVEATEAVAANPPVAEPVTVYFSFGHGQHDPDTGKSLLDHYVTIVGPSYEACRKAMFASKYGHRWAFDYLKGDPESDKWIARWTEHDRIVLAAAADSVDDEPVHYRDSDDDGDQVACGVPVDDLDGWTTRPGSATCPACTASVP